MMGRFASQDSEALSMVVIGRQISVSEATLVCIVLGQKEEEQEE